MRVPEMVFKVKVATLVLAVCAPAPVLAQWVPEGGANPTQMGTMPTNRGVNPYFTRRTMINPYARTGGFYNPGIGAVNYPAFGVPQAIGGGFYQVPSGRVNLPMWRAPSGYFYPWAPRPAGFSYGLPMPILIVQQASQSPSPALPPVSVAMSDLEKYLEKSKTNKKLAERDYTNMMRRVKDLKSKERTLRIAGGGSLNPADEAQIRRDLDQVGSELSWRLNR